MSILHYDKRHANGYGPRHRGLMFDGEESKYELWEIKFMGYMRLRKLSDTIYPEEIAMVSKL